GGGIATSAFRHDLRLVGAEGEGRDQWPRVADPGELMRLRALAFGLELPQRAIDRVARPAARHVLPQLFAADARLDRLPMRFELTDDVGRIVTEIIDSGRLAAPDVLAIGQF